MVERASRTSPRARRTSTRTGRSSTRRSGCRTATRACASTRAAPAARPGYLDSGRRARRGTSTTASSGRRAAVVERQGRAHRDLLLRDEPVAGGGAAAAAPRPRSARGRARPTGTATRAPRRHPVRRSAASGFPPGIRVQHGLGARGLRSRMTGDWVSGPETLTEEELGAEPRRLLAGLREHPLATTGTAIAHARLVEGDGAAPVRRQLGRPGPAPARQHRGLRARRVAAEVARGARHRALDALLHGLRRRAAEAVLRPLPQGRGQRLARQPRVAAPGSPSRRAVRRARGERVAARAHAVDEVLPRPGAGTLAPGAGATEERVGATTASATA